MKSILGSESQSDMDICINESVFGENSNNLLQCDILIVLIGILLTSIDYNMLQFVMVN